MHKKMREIAELKAKGLSNRSVAEKTGYARNTVNKIVKQINESGLTDDKVRNLSDQMLSEHFNDHLNVHQFKDILKRKAGESIEVD